ncbi:MAG: ABC transporter permease subunit [Thermoplasmatota archaeon]|nr:ABC transporter permease subunit [Halobacteriales archaeon]
MGGAGTVLWKEVREQYLRGGRPVATVVVTAAVTVLFALVAPFVLAATVSPAARTAAVTAALVGGVGVVSFFSMVTPIAVAVDAVAGERERHTLETLLASPLSDRAIVLGKAGAILAAVGCNAALYVVCASISAIAILGLAGLLVAGILLVAVPAGAFLTSTYTTGLGFLISLRAATVKQGQQWLGYAMMPFFILPGLSGALGGLLFRTKSPWLVVIAGAVAGAVFLGLNALWWTLLLTRFRRDRLLSR